MAAPPVASLMQLPTAAAARQHRRELLLQVGRGGLSWALRRWEAAADALPGHVSGVGAPPQGGVLLGQPLPHEDIA